ncbi:MAG: hypothetical protein ACQKBU_04540 [Verrucomicrobiales bacterium]
MPASTLTEFHHWLLSEDPPGAPYVILFTRDQPSISYAPAVARHLNEYDDRSNGNWIAMTTEVVHAIAADASQRRLLGLGDPCPKCPPTSECGIRRVLTALAKRGHLIFDLPQASHLITDGPHGFRAAIGTPPEDELEDYHLILRPEAFGSRCLTSLIGDSFLEWANAHHPA